MSVYRTIGPLVSCCGPVCLEIYVNWKLQEVYFGCNYHPRPSLTDTVMFSLLHKRQYFKNKNIMKTFLIESSKNFVAPEKSY